MTKITKAYEIQQRLADDIVHGRLTPGTAIDETVFAKRLGVSRTPVREAIRQLGAAGLVESRPHRGAVVTEISSERLDDMFAVMAEMEALCARWSALAMSARDRRALRDIHAASVALVRGGDRDGYIQANEAFHAAIYDGAYSPFLAETTRNVRLRLQPFRRVQFEGPARLGKSFAEHERVLVAIERGDAATAEAEMRSHIGVVRAAVDSAKRLEGGWSAAAPTPAEI